MGWWWVLMIKMCLPSVWDILDLWTNGSERNNGFVGEALSSNQRQWHFPPSSFVLTYALSSGLVVISNVIRRKLRHCWFEPSVRQGMWHCHILSFVYNSSCSSNFMENLISYTLKRVLWSWTRNLIFPEGYFLKTDDLLLKMLKLFSALSRIASPLFRPLSVLFLFHASGLLGYPYWGFERINARLK